MDDMQNNQQHTNSSPSSDEQSAACEQCKQYPCICRKEETKSENIDIAQTALSQASAQDEVKPPKMSWI